MNSPIVFEKTFDSPAENIWSALTDNNEMKKWYFQLEEFKPEVGFKFCFAGGPEDRVYIHRCEVTEVVKGQKISYSWKYEGYPGVSQVQFELFPEGGKTKLKVTHSALENFPADNPDFAATNFELGWKQIIGENLPKYLTE